MGGILRVLLISKDVPTSDWGLGQADLQVQCCKLDDLSSTLPLFDIDAIILDADPEVDAALERLRESKRRWPAVPVLFVTAQSSEGIVLKAFRYGARDFFKKPADIGDLRRILFRLSHIKNDTGRRRPALYVNDTHSPPSFLNSSIPANIIKVIGYIRENLQEDFRLDLLARLAGMSKYHFSRAFKAHVGVPPKRFVLSLRLQKAKSYLGCTKHSVTQIAQWVGFNDLSNFNRLFKKEYGLAPGAFRKLPGIKN